MSHPSKVQASHSGPPGSEARPWRHLRHHHHVYAEADRLKTVQAAVTEVPRGGCTADAAGAPEPAALDQPGAAIAHSMSGWRLANAAKALPARDRHPGPRASKSSQAS
jgi:hypothetical protein